MSEALAQIERQLQAHPALLQVLRGAIRAFRDHPSVGATLKGSLISGTADRYSDIDVAVVLLPGASLSEERAWVHATVSSAGRLLAHFPATHLDMPNLLIFFLGIDQRLVKVDVELVSLDEFDQHPDGLIISDPEGRLIAAQVAAASRTSETVDPDFVDIHQKFCGWTWYTYAKLARGEYFEAVDSLDVMRRQALLPCLHYAERLVPEGYRRLEERLTPPRLDALRRTFPTSFAPDELLRALYALAELFADLQPMVAQRLGWDHRRADLEAMLAVVERAERERTAR